jgi:predicted Zn finger-like uncharacterized protein
MSISIRCPACGVALRVDDSLAGRKVRCSGCNKPFTAEIEPPDDEPEEEDRRPAKRTSLRRPAVDQPLIPRRAPRDSDEERPKPMPVWKREMMGASIYFGCIGAFFLLVIGGSLVFFFFFNKTVTSLVPPAAPAKSELDTHLKSLTGLDPNKRIDAARRLRGAEPNVPRRNDMAKALANCLNDANPESAKAASEALVVWATPTEAPALAAALSNPSPEVRKNCLQALEKFGPSAEQPILNRLENNDKTSRRELCALLGRIGTKASLPALERIAATDSNPVVKRTAEGAVRAIQERNP